MKSTAIKLRGWSCESTMYLEATVLAAAGAFSVTEATEEKIMYAIH
jgi:hypothetical protein